MFKKALKDKSRIPVRSSYPHDVTCSKYNYGHYFKLLLQNTGDNDIIQICDYTKLI